MHAETSEKGFLFRKLYLYNSSALLLLPILFCLGRSLLIAGNSLTKDLRYRHLLPTRASKLQLPRGG